jgi:hypothetical protein
MPQFMNSKLPPHEKHQFSWGKIYGITYPKFGSSDARRILSQRFVERYTGVFGGIGKQAEFGHAGEGIDFETEISSIGPPPEIDAGISTAAAGARKRGSYQGSFWMCSKSCPWIKPF